MLNKQNKPISEIVEALRSKLLMAWRVVHHTSISGSLEEVEEADKYAKSIEKELVQTLQDQQTAHEESLEKAREEERERSVEERRKLQDIKDAWNIEGRNPEYHRNQKVRLAAEWPTLFAAIQALTQTNKDI